VADAVITPQKLDTFEQHVGTAGRLGGVEIQTIRGPVFAVDAPGYSTMLLSFKDQPEQSRAMLLLYEPGRDGSKGAGMMAQLDADQARTVAASLLRLAALIDTRKPN